MKFVSLNVFLVGRNGITIVVMPTVSECAHNLYAQGIPIFVLGCMQMEFDANVSACL